MNTIAENNYPAVDNIGRIIEEKGMKRIFVAEKTGMGKQKFCDVMANRRLIKVCDILRNGKAEGDPYLTENWITSTLLMRHGASGWMP